MNTQHTPGPWEIRLNEFIVDKDGSIPICKLLKNVDANARIIAAAPELLEACEEMLKSMKWSASVIKDIPANATFYQNILFTEQAIKKAKGE